MATQASDRTTPTSVYRYFDAAGVLIYVGITSTGILRNRQHNDDKVWWQWVASQEVEHFPSSDEAHAREVALIQKFRPPFNTQHNTESVDIRNAYMAVRKLGLYDIDRAALLPMQYRRLFVQVRAIDPAAGTAELRTHMEQAPAVFRMQHVERVQVINGRGAEIGTVDHIEKFGLIACVHLRLISGWTFQSAILSLRPIVKKGPIEYQIGKVITSEAERTAEYSRKREKKWRAIQAAAHG